MGQVCVLSLQPEPNVTSCNGVCNARILCVAAVPAAVLSPGAPAPPSSSSAGGSSYGTAPSSGRTSSALLEEHGSLSGDEASSPPSARASTSSASTCTLPAFSSTGSLTPAPSPSHATSSGRLTPTRPTAKVGSPPPPAQPPIGQFQLDSDSSDDDEDGSPDEEAATGRPVPDPNRSADPPLSPTESGLSSPEAGNDANQPTMWLGTEDGW